MVGSHYNYIVCWNIFMRMDKSGWKSWVHDALKWLSFGQKKCWLDLRKTDNPDILRRISLLSWKLNTNF
ncbi:hypothetical protein KUTeg_002334 [Tegillarca granosa]|uniref:Uncharacterized protein n=1 Tax=Tegillarca granosa TaxID=220873 RepID=A0ABQ9FVC6_TEGGR|nr:hypothetical protein KUTeg_002334 [Tegillarca granosa]